MVIGLKTEITPLSTHLGRQVWRVAVYAPSHLPDHWGPGKTSGDKDRRLLKGLGLHKNEMAMGGGIMHSFGFSFLFMLHNSVIKRDCFYGQTQ